VGYEIDKQDRQPLLKKKDEEGRIEMARKGEELLTMETLISAQRVWAGATW